MLMPKRVKYRKVQRGRMTGVASRGNKVVYGEYGIQAMEPGWITGNQIEAARRPWAFVWVPVKARPRLGWPLSRTRR